MPSILFTSTCCLLPRLNLRCLCHTLSPVFDTSYLDCLPQYINYIYLHSLKVVEAGLILSSFWSTSCCLTNHVKIILSERRCYNIHLVIKFSNLPHWSNKKKSRTSHHKYSKIKKNVHELVIQITVQKIAKPKWTFTSYFRYIQSLCCKVFHPRKRHLCKI